MRKKQAKKRPLLPDPRFNDQLVTRFVNMMMWDGKKSVAFGVFYDAIDIVDAKKTDEEKTALELWKDALSNVMPHVEVRSRRGGGATFQIPMQIRLQGFRRNGQRVSTNSRQEKRPKDAGRHQKRRRRGLRYVFSQSE